MSDGRLVGNTINSDPSSGYSANRGIATQTNAFDKDIGTAQAVILAGLL